MRCHPALACGAEEQNIFFSQQLLIQFGVLHGLLQFDGLKPVLI
jgi:hypothetical protein